MNSQALINAAMWPVRDVPKIFQIGQTGFRPALPGLGAIGATAAVIYWDPMAGSSWKDLELPIAYAAGAAAALVLNMM